MDPISFGIELELGTLLLALVGGIATYMQNRHQRMRRKAMERHHLETLALEEQHHREHMTALRVGEEILEETVAAPKVKRSRPAPARRPRTEPASAPRTRRRRTSAVNGSESV